MVFDPDTLVYNINGNNGMAEGFPRPITDLWRELPAKIDASLYARVGSTYYNYFFKVSHQNTSQVYFANGGVVDKRIVLFYQNLGECNKSDINVLGCRELTQQQQQKKTKTMTNAAAILILPISIIASNRKA